MHLSTIMPLIQDKRNSTPPEFN